MLNTYGSIESVCIVWIIVLGFFIVFNNGSNIGNWNNFSYFHMGTYKEGYR